MITADNRFELWRLADEIASDAHKLMVHCSADPILDAALVRKLIANVAREKLEAVAHCAPAKGEQAA